MTGSFLNGTMSCFQMLYQSNIFTPFTRLITASS